MKRDILRGRREQSGRDASERWTSLTYDATGVDGDIEMLIHRLQDRYGYTRNKANAELVRRLSFAVAVGASGRAKTQSI